MQLTQDDVAQNDKLQLLSLRVIVNDFPWEAVDEDNQKLKNEDRKCENDFDRISYSQQRCQWYNFLPSGW